ncbi:MAG: hypothetical protein M3P27_02010 [Acidobacteriota bacterium]|nr:hypothetical protein [Acidobacteriota bacterium]
MPNKVDDCEGKRDSRDSENDSRESIGCLDEPSASFIERSNCIDKLNRHPRREPSVLLPRHVICLRCILTQDLQVIDSKLPRRTKEFF